MAYSYEAILTANAQDIEAEQMQAAADLEAARHREDADAVRFASRRILDLDGERERLAARANNYYAGQQQHQAQQQRSKYNLSDRTRLHCRPAWRAEAFR